MAEGDLYQAFVGDPITAFMGPRFQDLHGHRGTYAAILNYRLARSAVI